MLVLHNNLACLAAFADKKESGARWAVTGVQVEALPDNRYAAVATDTKALIVIEGTCPGEPGDYPLHGGLVDAPNGATKALIPAIDFAEIMKESAKGTKSIPKPVLRTVAIQMADAVVTKKGEDNEEPIMERRAQVVMGWTNLAKGNTPTVIQAEGRFPPYSDIIPKKSPLCRIPLDPEFLVRMADALKAVKPAMDRDCPRVEMDFYGEDKPILFRFENPETTQKGTVLIMPLATDRGSVCYDGFHMAPGLMDEDYWKGEAERLQISLGQAKATIQDHQEKIGELKTLLSKTQAGADTMKEIDDLNDSVRAYKEQRTIDLKTMEELRDEKYALEEKLEALGIHEPQNVVEALDGEDLRGIIAELRRDMAGMESELLQTRLRLSAAEEDRDMYRTRSEGGSVDTEEVPVAAAS